MCLESQWNSMGFQVQEPQQEEEGQAQEGEIPGQI